MRIYGNGILKTRSVGYSVADVHRYRRVGTLKDSDEIAIHVHGTHGEALHMHMTLKTARSLVEKLQAQLNRDPASVAVLSEDAP